MAFFLPPDFFAAFFLPPDFFLATFLAAFFLAAFFFPPPPPPLLRAGAVRVYAEVIAVEGKTVTLSVAIYPLEGEVLNVGVKEMLQGVRPILQKLADKGVEEVIITAKRLSGANPGRDLYLRIKLK